MLKIRKIEHSLFHMGWSKSMKSSNLLVLLGNGAQSFKKD